MRNHRLNSSHILPALLLLVLGSVLAFHVNVNHRVQGGKVDIPGYTWQDSRETLVIAVRYGCHYCEASLPFYAKLWNLAGAVPRERLRILFISPDNEYLASRTLPPGIPMDSVRTSVIFPNWVVGTPTIIAINQTGTVVRVWEGMLNGVQEQEVLKILRSP
jgi:hypothetical protein